MRSKNCKAFLFHICFSILLLQLSLTNNFAQSKKYEKTFYGGLFYITDMMTTSEYKDFRKCHSDLETVDYIFDKTLTFYDGDVSETCFCLTFAVIPFNKILIRLPLFGSVIRVPLPSPPNSVFQRKLENTPKDIFCDSPKSNFGDKDKLAHFFANAFLKYNSGVFNLSEFLGIFVEYIEQGFFVQGNYDLRDLIANHLGEVFAEMLKNNIKSKPSDALKVYQLLYFRMNP